MFDPTWPPGPPCHHVVGVDRARLAEVEAVAAVGRFSNQLRMARLGDVARMYRGRCGIAQ